MSKSARLVELLLGAGSLTIYINFVLPLLPTIPVSQQFLVNLSFLGFNLFLAWFIIRSIRRKQMRQIGQMSALTQSLIALVFISGGAIWATQANLLGPYGMPGDVYHLLILISAVFFTWLIFLSVVLKRKTKAVG